MTRVALVTCLRPSEPDADETLLLSAVRARGLDARVVAWDEPAVDWRAFTLCVLRSCWDYHLRRDEFLAWYARTAAVARVANPPAVVAWNTHKSYLAELAARGVDAVPTLHLPRGQPVEPLGSLLAARGWHDVVMKPAVSAGSFRTARFRGDALRVEAPAFLDALLAERDALVQPYLPAVDGPGERSLVWIDGAFTHAMRKTPRFSGDAERVTGPHPIADDERAVATQALACAPSTREGLLYARVDLARDEASGRPLVMELELTEPSLFLRQHPPACERLADAIARSTA